MKYLLKFIILASVFILNACSTDNNSPKDPADDNEENTFTLPENCKFQLMHVDTQGDSNIFDTSIFSIRNNRGEENLFYSNQLKEAFDSIIWEVGGFNARIKIFDIVKENGVQGITLSSQWSQCFYFPGEYKSMLLGYRGKKVIYSDTIVVKVKASKDFLGYNWADIRDNGDNIGYSNELYGYEIATIAKLLNNKPYVMLSIPNEKNISESIFLEKSKECLYYQMNHLYGAPRIKDNPTALQDIYKTFNSYYSEALPIAYWETTKSRIMLLKREEGELTSAKYYVDAEPLE